MTLAAESIAVVLPAAGKSRRFGGDRKKIFSLLDDRMVWEHAVARLRERPEVGRIVIAIDPDDADLWEGVCSAPVARHRVELVAGGDERVESVRRALATLGEAEWIAVHDAARPLVRDEDLARLFAAAEASEAAILATPLRGTVKREGAESRIAATVDRRGLWEALTPQLFRGSLLRDAYARWRGFPVTDDAQLVERAGAAVRLVVGSPTNLKITVADDLAIAAALLAAERQGRASKGRASNGPASNGQPGR
ncbi:2-C-methyl-D-erythritol 4-phosphate cytidylyltransferase [Candidatus Laterigemmans baculatus]|uniref:2-C-methyl-D-erythritol 4-phosphate cytidylyltransferase n=1 Tax=Candidatus Laterigemmans baculatus TaxID=2770505 RepID=UPI0013D990D8|nr:2-C-methyl-D-erythritol 4-phosphate cytidylyltransferase [Candidatus Laterigemmans baculatus]